MANRSYSQILRAACSPRVMLMAALALPSIASAEMVAVPNDIPATLKGATLVQNAAAARHLSIAIVLPSRDPQGAKAFATAVNAKGSKQFHQYLTPAQFAQRFGASPESYANLVKWATDHNLRPGEAFAAMTVLPLSGTVADLEAALSVRFQVYKDAQGRMFYAADRAPTLDAAVARQTTGVFGMTDKAGFANLVKVRPASAAPQAGGTAPNGAYAAADLRSIYGVPPQASTTRTETLALFEQGGFDPTDIAVYEKANKLPAVPVLPRSVNGYGRGINDPSIELEAVLDIDMLVGMNPQASKVIVYEDGADSFGVALLDALSAMATEDRAQTVSISYGLDETTQGVPQMQAENTVFTQMAAQGQGVFVSAGDQGAYGRNFFGLNVEDPSSQPFVVAVGGTTLFTNNQQQRTYETTWNELAGAGIGTGGGVSAVFALPSYQALGSTSVAANCGGSATMRNVPDVTAVGDPFTGVAVYSALNGGWVSAGGTSASAPIWAGLASVADANSRLLGFGQLGFLNPTFTGLENLSLSSYLGVDFNDIVDGTNGIPNDQSLPPGYAACGGEEFRSGFDDVSGWGAPGPDLVNDLALVSLPTNGGTLPAPIGLAITSTPTTATLTWHKVKGATGYLAGGNTGPDGHNAYLIAGAPSATFLGLTPATTYQLDVCSLNTAGSTCSGSIITTTPRK